MAPVRETCAQALGTVCRYLTPTCVQSIVHKLCEIINHQVWEVRYGSVLGLKYIIAVRQVSLSASHLSKNDSYCIFILVVMVKGTEAM